MAKELQNLTVCVTYCGADHQPQYTIKRDDYTRTYYLFTVKNGKEQLTKHSANSPLDLEKYIKIKG